MRYAATDPLHGRRMQFDRLKRREFIAVLGGAAATWPLRARAQQENRVRRVGVLMSAAATEVEYQGYLAAFLAEMRRLGWSEGQNLQIAARWNAGDAILSRTYAAQLIGAGNPVERHVRVLLVTV